MSDKRTPGFAIVSGASSGIGLACAKELARRGRPLALIARDAARLEKARAIVAQAGAPEVLVFPLTSPTRKPARRLSRASTHAG